MGLCSRETVPACRICDAPTMEAGVDENPYATGYFGDGYVCSEPCELRDTLESAGPVSEWIAILDAAHRLTVDYGDFTAVRIHRAACTPVEGIVFGLGDMDVLLEDANGDEVCVLLGMIERVEVVRDG